jgi:O-antigen/teichoic acid export membrane protein
MTRERGPSVTYVAELSRRQIAHGPTFAMRVVDDPSSMRSVGGRSEIVMTIVETRSPAESLPISPWRLRWQLAQTRIATVGDQLIVALTNFALTLAIGRIYSAEEFAAYGIGVSIALMVQGLQRHAITIPLMLQPAAIVTRRARSVVGEQAIALVMALGCALLCLWAASLVGISRYATLIVASSAVLLLVYFQLEFTRAFLVKIGKPWLLLASAGWYCVVAGVAAAGALWRAVPYEALLAILAAAMVLQAVAVMAVAGTPRLQRGWLLLWRDLRRYGGWAAAATLTYTGYNHVPLLLLGALAAPRHAAAFVAARSQQQPLQILLRGFDIADKSRFAERAHGVAGESPLRFTLRLAALYAGIAILFGALIVAFAGPIIELAYGAKFAGDSAALIAWVPVYVFLSVTLPLESLVYARNAFAPYFAVRGLASIVAIAVAFPLIRHFAEVGAIAACAIGWLIAAAGTALVLLRRPAP